MPATTNNACASPGLLSVDEGLRQLLSAAQPLADVTNVPLAKALHRVLAEDVASPMDVPPMANSAMDGYAVTAADAAGPGPFRLPVSQRVTAGQVPQEHTPGTAARVFTGAAVPPGADTVIAQEDVTEQDGCAVFTGPIRQGTFVKPAGQDFARGSQLVARGTRLRPQELGLTASAGISTLPIYEPLRVALLTTGSELVWPGSPLPAGKIYNANHFTLLAQLQSLGLDVIADDSIPDDAELTLRALDSASQAAQVIVTSGGVSVGEEDHVKAAVETLGSLDLWRLAVKPGKPLAFGRVGDAAFIGLPGNPVSVFVTFCLFARPFLLRCQGMANVAPRTYPVTADFQWPKPGSRREFARARLRREGQSMRATLYPDQGSAVLSSAVWADGLVCIPEQQTVELGQTVDFYPFSELL